MIVSFALVPATDSTPFWSLGSLICEALLMSSVAAALAGADAIPTAAATTAAEAASRAARRFLSRARLFMVSPLWNAMSVVESQGRRSLPLIPDQVIHHEMCTVDDDR